MTIFPAILKHALHFTTVVKIAGSAGSYSAGIWTAGSETESNITASVQPASSETLQRLPEGLDTSDVVEIYTDDDLSLASAASGTPSDRIRYQGNEYEVIQIERWTMGQMPHKKAVAVRTTLTGNSVS